MEWKNEDRESGREERKVFRKIGECYSISTKNGTLPKN
jgi:hypothetical protein